MPLENFSQSFSLTLAKGLNTNKSPSSFINFGCIYEDAINFDVEANVDDGSCEYLHADLNGDGIINILDIIELVNTVLE